MIDKEIICPKCGKLQFVILNNSIAKFENEIVCYECDETFIYKGEFKETENNA